MKRRFCSVFILVAVFGLALRAFAAPSSCTISGAVYAPDGSTINNGTVTFAPAGQVPQIIGGQAIYPKYVSTTTDSSGNLVPISLLQGAAMNVTICQAGGSACSALVYVSVPAESSVSFALLLANTQISGGSGVTAVTGTAPIVSSGGTTPAISLATSGVSAGSYTNASITVGANGLLTSASNGGSGTISTPGLDNIGATTTFPSLSGGIGNSAFGIGTLNALTSGIDNAAFGNGASGHLTTGAGSVAIGNGALGTNTTGLSSTAVGDDALGSFNDTGSGTDNNTAIGNSAGASLTTGTGNIFLGVGGNITTGSSNILIGNSLANTTATTSNQLDIADYIYGSDVAGGTVTLNGTLNAINGLQINGVPVGSGGGVTAVTGTAPIASSGGTTPAISLNASGVTAGSYTSANLTITAQGLITAASNGSGGSGITSAYTQTTNATIGSSITLGCPTTGYVYHDYDLTETASAPAITLSTSGCGVGQEIRLVFLHTGAGGFGQPAISASSGSVIWNVIPGGATPTFDTAASKADTVAFYYGADSNWHAVSFFLDPSTSAAALLNPMTTLGDIIYGGASGTPTRLGGNTNSYPEYFGSQGSGGSATAPVLFTPANIDVRANNSSTGTVQNELAQIIDVSGTSTVGLASASQASGILGISAYSPGTTGVSGTITHGIANCVFSAAATDGDFFVGSATGGKCTDIGTTCSSSQQNLGVVTQTNASAGTDLVFIDKGICPGGSGGGAVSSVSGTANQVSVSPTTGATVVSLPPSPIVSSSWGAGSSPPAPGTVNPSGTAHGYVCTEGTSPTVATSEDGINCNSTTHRMSLSNNGVAVGSVGALVGTATVSVTAPTAVGCTDGTVAVTNSTTTMAVLASPASNPNGTSGAVTWSAYVSAAGTVDVRVCNLVVETSPPATTYNVQVYQ
jgi:hypothetical protein